MRSLLAFALLVPSVAFAQGAPGQTQPAPTTPAPAPTPAPGTPPSGPPAPPPYQPQTYEQMYGLPPSYIPPPVYPPPPKSLHDGMTFELGIGCGWINASDGDQSRTTDLSFAGLDLGIGGWLDPKLALTGRLSAVTNRDNGSRLTDGFLGASLQYWADDHIWLAGGAGLAFIAYKDPEESDSLQGFGLDLRIGYTFTAGTENTVHASFELTPGFFSENSDSVTITGVALLLGYQHL